MSVKDRRGGNPRIIAAMVAYGEGPADWAVTLERLSAQGIDRLVVVNNGMSVSSRTGLEELQHGSELPLVILSPGLNLGSAGGYNLALEHALGCPEELVWLLDEDNLPSPGCLRELVWWQDILCETFNDTEILVAAWRVGRGHMDSLATGVPGHLAEPHRYSFHNLDLIHQVARRLYGRTSKDSREPSGLPVQMTRSAYGGLLISKVSLRRHDLPVPELFLYEDDAEWTSRMTSAGALLFLVPSARIEDARQSWYEIASGSTPWAKLVSSPDDFRVYYAVRNRAWREMSAGVGSELRYRFNRWVFMFLVIQRGIRHGRLSRCLLIVRAVHEGNNGRLGEGMFGG